MLEKKNDQYIDGYGIWIMEPLIIIDTTGAEMNEELCPEGVSFLNKDEAAFVFQAIILLIERGVQERDIGVISPYKAQAEHIRERLSVTHKGVEVSTIDGFQGREKEIIIISTVRSNSKGQIGFLSNEKRMNVAVTRAKRSCMIIGDSKSISQSKFLRKLFEYFSQKFITEGTDH